MDAKVIVIGVTHHNTLGMIRCMGIEKFRVDLILIGSKGSYVTKSRFIKKVYAVDNIDDVLPVLRNEYKLDKNKPIILTCTDHVACLLDDNFEELNKKFIFFNCGHGKKLCQYMDKKIQTTIAREEGIKVPLTTIYPDELNKIIYPCILKPLMSINGGKKILICHSEAELKENIKKYKCNENILIQQFIEKKEEIVLLGMALNGRITIPGFIRKYRDFDGGTLYSHVEPISHIDSFLISRCKQLIQRMNYEGLFGIELIFDGKDFYFIEVNLRNDATTYSLAVGGVNLPVMYVKSKLGQLELTNTYEVEEIYSIVEFNDFKHRKEYNVSLKSWLKQFKNSKCKYYFNIVDPLPFILAPFKK